MAGARVAVRRARIGRHRRIGLHHHDVGRRRLAAGQGGVVARGADFLLAGREAAGAKGRLGPRGAAGFGIGRRCGRAGRLLHAGGVQARLLALQDDDGQWAGGAYFPTRADPRAVNHPDDDEGQPYTATTWTLNTLRDWGLDASALAGTAEKLGANSRWE